MLTLYDFGNSVACQKVRITLCEKGLDWQSIMIDLFRSEQYDPKYLEFNPKGVVPTLVHDGVPIIESTLICEYLDETFPEPPLIPTDPRQRAQMRLWSKAVDEGLHEGVTEISFSAMFRERMKSMPAELREARFRNIGDPRRRDRFKSTYEFGVQSPFVLYAIAAYERAFAALEKALAKAGPWVLGREPTLADINLMPYVARLDYLGLLGVWTDHRPHIAVWWVQAQEWPSFKCGLSDRVTEQEFAEMRAHGPKIRTKLPHCLLGAMSRTTRSRRKDATMDRTAKCQCGGLRAKVSDDPLLVLVCHCSACQHRTGAPFSYCAYFERSKVRFEGLKNSYEREGQAGRKLCYYFCPTCGTTVYWELDFRPDRYGIAATLFDEKSFPPPTLSIWDESKCDWVVLPHGMTHLQRQPDS